MALRFMDGFDHYGTTGNVGVALAKNYTSYSQGDGGAIIYAGRYGGYGTSRPYTEGETYWTKAIDGTGVGGWYIGFNYKMLSTTESPFGTGSSAYAALTISRSNDPFDVYYSGKYSMRSGLTLFTNGEIRIGEGSQFISYATSGIAVGTWAHCEVYIQNSTGFNGTITCWINGVQKTTYASNNFNYNGTWKIGAFYGGDSCVIDDFYILDNTGSNMNSRLATTTHTPRIETLFPSSDVTMNFNLTGAANGNECLSPIPPSSGRYISSDTTDEVAEMGMTDLSTITTPKAIMTSALLYNNIGGTTQAKAVINGTEVGSLESITESTFATAKYRNSIFATNPVDSSDWSVSSINSITSGIKNKT